jgi:hypothetical protein
MMLPFIVPLLMTGIWAKERIRSTNQAIISPIASFLVTIQQITL